MTASSPIPEGELYQKLTPTLSLRAAHDQLGEALLRRGTAFSSGNPNSSVTKLPSNMNSVVLCPHHVE